MFSTSLVCCLAALRPLAAQSCAPLTTAGQAADIHGVVRDDRGEAAPNSRVTATWQEWRLSGYTLSELDRKLEVDADGGGAFQFCGVPRQATVTVIANRGGRQSMASAVRPGGPPVALSLLGATGITVVPSIRLPLTGFVRDSAGNRLGGVRLSLPDGVAGISDDRGDFQLFPREPGEFDVEVRRLGYRPKTVRTEFPVRGGPVEIVLEVVPILLAEVTTVAAPTPFESYSGFSERRKRNPGTFIDRSDIERSRPHELTDVLRAVPGVNVQTGLTRWGYQATPSLGRSSGGMIGCRMTYYVNGHEYTPTSMGIDSDFSPQQIEALEVYKASEVPAQFLGSRARCGVVVIWTRYRAHELER